MAELAGAPWRALAKIVLDNGTGTRTWAVGVGIADETASGDQGTWTGAPGTSLTLTYQTGTTGITPPGSANTVTIEIRTPDGAQIGATDWTNPADDETRTFHFDDDPLDEAAGTNRWGCFEIYIHAQRTDLGTYEVDTRGLDNGAGTPDWAQGYLRSPVTLSSESLSDTSLGGAEPAEFWYPDSIFFRGTLSDVCVEAFDLDFGIGAIRSKTDSGTDVTRDYSLTTANETVDADFVNATEDLTLTLPTTTFGGDAKFIWSSSGHDADFTRTSDAVLTDADRFTVDPSVSFVNLALDGAASDVFNRGEVCGGSIEIHNAGGEKFAPQGNDVLEIIRTADSSVEETVDSVTRDGSDVLQWDVTFDTSGNTAPADATGDEKALRWSDSSGANSPTADSTAIGLLSSLLDVAIHLQNNDSTLNPAVFVDTRLTSDLGFYSIKIENQRGQGVNGVSVTDHLQDDASLTSSIDRTDTTGSQNGNDGYLPLKAWDASLPGGGWDHWTDAGTHDGNSFEKARSGSSTFDYTLLAASPSLKVICEGGPVIANRAKHMTPDETQFATFIGVVDVAVDSTLSSQTVKVVQSATVALFRIAPTGAAQYLDDSETWTNLTPGTAIDFHVATETAVGSGVFSKTFTTDSTWGESDVVCLGKAIVDGTPYGGVGKEIFVGADNGHGGYVFDGAGFLGFPFK